MSHKPNPSIGIPGAKSAHLRFVVSARDLPMRDRGCTGATVQDPYIRFSAHDNTFPSKDFKNLSSTKHRVNEPNPEYFDSVFEYDWVQGMGQVWRFEVKDFDVVNKDDAIGHVEIKVDDYVLKDHEEKYIKLQGAAQGALLIKKVSVLKFKLAAKNLPNKDAFNGLSDPYVEAHWSQGTGAPLNKFHTTKIIKNVTDCQWDDVIEYPVYQPMTNQVWTFKVFDKDTLKDDALGTCQVSVDEFVNAGSIFLLPLAKEFGEKCTLILTPIAL